MIPTQTINCQDMKQFWKEHLMLFESDNILLSLDLGAFDKWQRIPFCGENNASFLFFRRI